MSAGAFYGLLTLLLMAIFVGIWAWAWSSRRRRAFEDAAHLPLEEDDSRREGGGEQP